VDKWLIKFCVSQERHILSNMKDISRNTRKDFSDCPIRH